MPRFILAFFILTLALLSFFSRKSNHEETIEAPILSDAKKSNACIFILCRNSDLDELKITLINFELKFNSKYNYPYLIVNNEEFSDKFKQEISAITSSLVEFDIVPKEHWEYPLWIDQNKAATVRKEYKAAGVLYGDMESYRFMCRFYSGFFYKQPLALKYDYYWRVEPGVKFTCDIPYDPFVYLEESGKQYGFTIALRELRETIPTLWKSVAAFVRNHKDFIRKDSNNLRFIVTDDGKYNDCHFWSNFEIASFDFFRSPKYQKFFDFLDKEGGFFYERWGDAPIHSIATALFLKKEQIHFFDDIGYVHHPFGHCPSSPAVLRNCDCDPKDSFDWTPSSCLRQWYSV